MAGPYVVVYKFLQVYYLQVVYGMLKIQHVWWLNLKMSRVCVCEYISG